MSPATLGLWLLLVATAPPSGRCVEIVETTDLHGHLVAEHSVEEKRELGGLDWLGGYLHRLRHGRNPVLVLDAGDLFQGTLASNASRGKAVIAAYDALGYTASVLGNHEFDFGAEAPDREIFGAIRHRLAEATFPFLAANVVDRRTGRLPAWPHLLASEIVDERGLKVGLVGIANPQTPSLTVRRNVEGLAFEDPVGPIVREAAKLRAEGAQLVVLIAHLGGSCDGAGGGAGESSCDPHSDIVRLLHALPSGTVDVALAGHNHRLIDNWIAGVPTVESGFGGRRFGWLTACARPRGGLDRARTVLHALVVVVPHGTFLGSEVSQDASVERKLAPYLRSVAAQESERVGPILRAPIVRDYNAPSPLGRLAAEALRQYAQADVALVNPGGLRADLPAGPLTYGALYQALPFENRIVVVTVSGRKLLELVSAIATSGHGYPQVSGLALRGTPPDWTATLDGGRPLDPTATYRLATVDFLAAGGDGLRDAMASVPKASVRSLPDAPVLREIVLAYLERRPEEPVH